MVKQLKHLTNLVRFKRGARIPIIGPLKAEWEVINICNARCQTCQFWRNHPDKNILSFEEAVNLIDQMAEMGVLKLCFTGGEPLLRKDLIDLIDYAQSKNLSTSLITNGFLITERRARELVDAKLESIYISLDAAEPRLNDEIRGFPGYYDLALKAMDNLKAMRRNANPKIYIKTTVSKLNLHHLVPLAKLSITWGIDGLRFQPAQYIEGTELSFDPDILLDEKDYELLANYIDKIIKNYSPAVKGFMNYCIALKHYYLSQNSFKNYRSVSGFSYAIIDPWGYVFASPTKKELLGNIRQQSLYEIWYGGKANEIRKDPLENSSINYLFDTVGNMSVYFSDLNVKSFFKIIRPIFNGVECF